MSAWRTVRLGEVCELKRGYDLPTARRMEGCVPIVSSSGVSGYHSTAKVTGPGVVTGRYGTLGQVFYLEEDFWPLNTALYVRDFKGNEPRYVAALLECMNLAQYDGAAAVPGLNRNQLHELPVPLADHSAQVAIAETLCALDGLVVNNRRRVEVLEDLARTIYREWFVNFRYPGFERVVLVDSDLGPIPEGWNVTTLGKAGQWLSGGTPRTSVPRYWGGPVPWITSGTLTSMLLDRSERTLTAEGVMNGTRLVERDTLIFVVRGMSLVKEFRVGIADVPVAFGQDCKAIVARHGIDRLYLVI